MDILLSAGERISMALLAMAVGELGVPARAYTGAQAGVLTDSKYGRASIVGVIPERIARVLDGQVRRSLEALAASPIPSAQRA